MTRSHAPIVEPAVVRREGFSEGYAGHSALHCPYTDGQLRHAWLQGWQIGRNQRARDYRDGTHPGLVARTEFQAESANRRGYAGGAK